MGLDGRRVLEIRQRGLFRLSRRVYVVCNLLFGTLNHYKVVNTELLGPERTSWQQFRPYLAGYRVAKELLEGRVQEGKQALLQC